MKRLLLAIASMSVLAAPAIADDKMSGTFLKKAIQGNLAEVQMGDLAQKNGQSADVKAYGKMLSDDHSAANQKALDAAKDMGVSQPTGPNSKQKADYGRMSKLTGSKFDKMFARDMVQDHKKDLAAYKKEAKQKNAAGQYASGEIDTLQKHLDAAKDLVSKKSASQ
jgi:putative membrane protein